jgi:uncharacterized protein (DUF1499 family)
MLAMLGLFGCSGTAPERIGVADGRLAPCPSSPNCVASDADDADHRVEPLRFERDPALVWAGLKAVLADRPRTTTVVADGHYLHAEAKSRVFGFIDDVEFHLRPAERLIAVRSASRVGKYDFGVNARRIESVRQALRAQGLTR